MPSIMRDLQLYSAFSHIPMEIGSIKKNPKRRKMEVIIKKNITFFL